MLVREVQRVSRELNTAGLPPLDEVGVVGACNPRACQRSLADAVHGRAPTADLPDRICGYIGRRHLARAG